MEVDLGKLFIGGISWDTREDGLREYFSRFGEVVEAVIMKDRNTGRARGFGFIVFADPAVAERVVLEKHTIDGRMVEAKKAVPRDDQQILNRNSSSVPGSPVPGRTKKIFVGGLPSTLTESDFKNYFDQFGTITDVVVMYDHNTQRPRGFGFITYDSEDAVDKALVKTFHELNGKIVEVKRAVPKELSPGPSNRPPISGYNYGLNRINNFVNGHTLGYNPSTISSFGMRMDGRLGPLASGRNGFTTFGPGLPISMDYEQNLNPSLAGNSGFNNNLNYGRALLNSYYSGNSSRFTSPNTYGSLDANSSSIFSSTARNLLGNTALNYATNASATNASMTSESGGIVSFDSGSLNCGNSSSLISSQLGGSGSGYLSRNPAYGSGEYMGLGGRTFERRIAPSNSNINSASGYDGSYAKLYSNSVYGDPTWQSALSELDVTSPFGYRLDNSDIDITDKGFADYMTGYNMNNRQPDRGIVT